MLDPDKNGSFSYNNNSTSYFANKKYTGSSTTLTEEDHQIAYDTSNFRNWKEEEEEADSGASTPPLWSPSRTRHQYQAGTNHLGYRTMSPNSRTQAIARGQRELMDMVSRMPEGCYELSLKDMVEHHHPVTVVEAKRETTISNSNSKVVPGRDHQKGTAGGLISGRSSVSGSTTNSANWEEGKKNKKKKAVVVRSGSFDNGGGLFLKMVFPVSFGSTKKGRLMSNSKGRGNSGGGVVDGRVSPRPLLLGEGEGSSRYKDGDGDWWRKEVDEEEEEKEGVGKESLGFSSSGKSGSSKSTGSSSSRSSSRNSTRHARFSCWSCIFSKKGKRAAA